MDGKDFWEKMKSSYNLTSVQMDNFLDFFSDNFTPVPETHQLVHEVIKTHKVGLLTNIYKDMYDRIVEKNHVPSLKYSAIVQSCYYNLAKPDKKIYTVAQELSQVNPEEILFTDDVQGNIDMAKQLGWNAIRFNEENPSETVNAIRALLD